METTIPLLPCTSLDKTLDFYRVLDFEITYEQHSPYAYGSVRRGGIELHFSRLTVYGAKNAFGACLVFVPNIEVHHRLFSDALRIKYGTIPTAGFPRIARLRKGHTRFKLFDPSGNVLIYINHNEPEMEYGASGGTMSDLEQAIENAAFLRDTYANDKAAAQALDKALARVRSADPVMRARALAARAELAVAMGDSEQGRQFKEALKEIVLSPEDQERFRDELNAAEDLERWMTETQG